MIKRFYTICMSALILCCTGCSSTSSQNEPKPNLISDNSTADIRDENRNFSAGLSITDYKDYYVYDGNPIPLTYHINNNGQAFEYAFFVFVNGKQIPYSTSTETEQSMTHSIQIAAESEEDFTLYLVPCGCKQGETALICIEAMLNPNYMLPDTSYVSFYPHHSLNGTTPFTVKVEVDAPDAKTTVSDIRADELQMTTELEKTYVYQQPMTNETVNQLDGMTLLECFQNDPLEPYLQAEGKLSLTINGLGVSGKYLVGVYIDHILQKAFNGSEYAVIDVERTKKKTLHPVIDLNGMTGLHHIYMIAVPYDPTDDIINRYPIKTETKLLQIGSANTSAITETTTITDNLISSEQQSLKQTEMSTQSTQSTYTTEIVGKTEIPAQSTSVPEIVSNSGEILRFGVMSDGTIISQTIDSVNTIQPDGTVIGTVPVSYMNQLQLLDNGFAVINNRNAILQIYDTQCRQIMEIHPPKLEDGRYIVSADGTRIAYSYRDVENGSIYRLMTDSIELNDRKTVLNISHTDKVGAQQSIDMPLSYRSGRISYTGNVLTKLKPKEDYSICCGSIAEDGSENRFSVQDKLHFSSVNLSSLYSTSDYYVILQDYDVPGAKQSNQVVLESILDGSKTVVACQSSNETHNAAVSEDGKFLLTLDETQHTLHIYNTATKKQLWKKALDTDAHMVWVCSHTKTVYWLTAGKIKSEQFTEN